MNRIVFGGKIAGNQGRESRISGRARTGIRRGIASFLTACLLLSLAACGSGDRTEGERVLSMAERTGFAYVPEYLSIDDKDASFYDMQFANDKIYYRYYCWDETTYESTNGMRSYDLTDKTIEELPFSTGESRNLNHFCVRSDGGMLTVEYDYSAQSQNTDGYAEPTRLLVRYNRDGSEEFALDLSTVLETDDSGMGYGLYLSGVVTDSEDRIYLYGDQSIYLFQADGQYAGEVELTSWINRLGRGGDGKVYASYYSYNGTGGSNVLGEVDFAARKISHEYENFPSGDGRSAMIPGTDHDFIVYDSSMVYGYDLETQEKEEIFCWLDSDINGTYVEGIGITGDGKILAIIRDWSGGDTELALLTKTEYATLEPKETVVIGTLYGSQSLQAAAVEFNRKSDKYHVSIQAYMDVDSWSETSYQDGINSIHNALISGSCPDLVDLSSLNGELLMRKKAIEDLNKYLEKSKTLSRDSFLENVLNVYTVGGKLVTIPRNFYLRTLTGKASVVGDKPGWTLEDMLALAKANPDKELFRYATRESILSMCLQYNQNQFVDTGKATCNFDSEEFAHVLEFAAMYPEDYNYDGERESEPAMMASGKLLLYDEVVSDFREIQVSRAMFDAPVTFVGYPTTGDDNGALLVGLDMLAIPARSHNKDGAWAFMEYFLSEYDSVFNSGFSSNLAKFDEAAEKAGKAEPVLDENGQPLLDEDGNVIYQGLGGMGWDDFSYEYHVSTPEELETIRSLIAGARTASTADQELYKIISEEAAAYFSGQKSAEDVCQIIQSRANMYMKENY